MSNKVWTPERIKALEDRIARIEALLMRSKDDEMTRSQQESKQRCSRTLEEIMKTGDVVAGIKEVMKEKVCSPYNFTPEEMERLINEDNIYR